MSWHPVLRPFFFRGGCFVRAAFMTCGSSDRACRVFRCIRRRAGGLRYAIGIDLANRPKPRAVRLASTARHRLEFFVGEMNAYGSGEFHELLFAFEHAERVQELLRQNGVELAPEDLLYFIKDSGSELTAAELNQVAGGAGWGRKSCNKRKECPGGTGRSCYPHC